MPHTTAKQRAERGGPLIPDPEKMDVAEIVMAPIRDPENSESWKCHNGCTEEDGRIGRARMLVNGKPYCELCLWTCFGIELGSGTDVASKESCA
jgi:hypothetical protein